MKILIKVILEVIIEIIVAECLESFLIDNNTTLFNNCYKFT